MEYTQSGSRGRWSWTLARPDLHTRLCAQPLHRSGPKALPALHARRPHFDPRYAGARRGPASTGHNAAERVPRAPCSRHHHEAVLSMGSASWPTLPPIAIDSFSNHPARPPLGRCRGTRRLIADTVRRSVSIRYERGLACVAGGGSLWLGGRCDTAVSFFAPAWRLQVKSIPFCIDSLISFLARTGRREAARQACAWRPRESLYSRVCTNNLVPPIRNSDTLHVVTCMCGVLRDEDCSLQLNPEIDCIHAAAPGSCS